MGTTLVEEVHQKRQRDAAEMALQAAAAQKQVVRAQRRRTRNLILFTIALVALFAGSAYGIKRFVDYSRIKDGLAAARTHLAAATPSDLENAGLELERNLLIQKRHAKSLGLMAIVRARQAGDGLITLDDARAAIEAAQERESSESHVAAGMLAAIDGDLETAQSELDSAAAPTGDPNAAWLAGAVARMQPGDETLRTRGLAELTASLDADGSSVPNRRLAAMLLADDRRFDEALEHLAATEESGHAGAAADAALIAAIDFEEPSTVLAAADAAIQVANASEADRAPARIARGLALLRKGEPDDAADELIQGWKTLPTWERAKREIAAEGLVVAQKIDKAKELRSTLPAYAYADAIFEARAALFEGDPTAALRHLGSLPQDLAVVAQIQALALVEQRRFAEAEQWVTFARTALPKIPELEVSEIRIAIQKGDAEARKRLEKIKENHPYAHRLSTALAESFAVETTLTDEQKKEQLKAIKRAIKREPAPAEALYLRAENYAAQVPLKPDAATDALDAYERATEASSLARYRSAYGIYLATLAHKQRAKEILSEVTSDTQADWKAFLALADLALEAALKTKKAAPQEVEGWLTEAGQRGADVWELELRWAQLELTRGTPQALQNALVRSQRLLAQKPQHVEGRKVHALTLIEQGRLDEARATLKDGIRRTLRKMDGPLYMAMARLDVVEGNERRAAGSAYTGWRKMVAEPRPPDELLETAPFVGDLFVGLGQERVASTIGKGLTSRVPYNAFAWTLRGEYQLAAEFEDGAKESAIKAVKLDPDLARAHALLGDYYRTTRRFKSAKAEYTKAAELAKGTPAARRYRRKAKRL